MLVIRAISPFAPEARVLIDELDRYQRSIYPEESNHLDSIHELAKPNVCFLGAYFGGRLVGIGAVKYLSGDCNYGEIKRVYVKKSTRRKGISRLLMKHLERNAQNRGISVLRLETGVHQPEALGLYEKLGYIRCGRFGEYPDDPLSVFMEKQLEGGKGPDE